MLAGQFAIQGAAAFASFGASAVENAHKVQALAKATGASAESIQVWQAIAQQAGASGESVKEAFKGLANAVSSANNGNKEASGVFKDLGVQLTDAEGKTRPMADLLREVGGALGEVEDPAKRAAVAQKVLGEAGIQLLPAFEGGREAVGAMVSRYEQLGVTSDATVGKLAAMRNTIEEMKLKFATVGSSLVVAFGPVIDTLNSTLLPLLPRIVEAFTPLIDVVAGTLGPVISAWMPIVATAIGALVPVVEKLAPVFAEVASVASSVLQPLLAGLGPILSELAGVFGETAMTLLAELKPALLELVPSLLRVAQAILPIVPALIGALLPAVLALLPAFMRLVDALVPLVERLAPTLVRLIEQLTPILEALANILAAVLEPAINIVASALDTWITGVETASNTLRVVASAAKAFWAAITGNESDLAEATTELDGAITTWEESIKDFGLRVLQHFADVFNNVADLIAKALAKVGIGDGDLTDLNVMTEEAKGGLGAKLEAMTANLNRVGPAGGLPVAQTINTNNTTNNQALTLNDNRTLRFDVHGVQTPAQTAREVSRQVDDLLTTDRKRTMDTVASHA